MTAPTEQNWCAMPVSTTSPSFRAGSFWPPASRPDVRHLFQLAETPHGSVLAPGQPASLDLIRQWFTEMLRSFRPLPSYGADETFELGRGQTKARVTQDGLGAVYVDFLKQIHTELTPCIESCCSGRHSHGQSKTGQNVA